MSVLSLLLELIQLSVNEAKEGVYITQPGAMLIEPQHHENNMKAVLEDFLPAGEYQLFTKHYPPAMAAHLRRTGKPQQHYVLNIESITEPGYAFDEGFVEKYALKNQVPDIGSLKRAVRSKMLKRLKTAGISDVEVEWMGKQQGDITKLFIADRDYLKLSGDGTGEDQPIDHDTPIDRLPGMKDTTSWRQKENGTRQWLHEPSGLTFVGTTYPKDAGMPGIFKYFKIGTRATPRLTNATPEQAAQFVTKQLTAFSNRSLL